MSEQLVFQRVDFDRVKEAYPDRWERAKEAEVDFERVDDAEWTITFADGDASHDALLYEDTEGRIGFCDCDGFAFHDDACAHLCRIGMIVALGNMDLPTPPADLHVQEPRQDDTDQETVDEADQDDGADERDQADRDDQADVAAEARPVDQPAGAIQPSGKPDPMEIDDQGEFVSEISGVPPAFVVEMGHGADSKPYITKEGLNYIARQQGIQTRAEPISPSWEEPDGMAAYRGIAIDADDRRYEDVGTAHAEEVEDTVGKENLDELASTRATNRALRLATGAGFASMEEVTGEDPVLEADQDLVDQDGRVDQ